MGFIISNKRGCIFRKANFESACFMSFKTRNWRGIREFAVEDRMVSILMLNDAYKTMFLARTCIYTDAQAHSAIVQSSTKYMLDIHNKFYIILYLIQCHLYVYLRILYV